MTLRLERWQGKWIARDEAGGYCAELSDCDAYTLAGDFHRCEELRLRVEASRFPKDLPQQHTPQARTASRMIESV